MTTLVLTNGDAAGTLLKDLYQDKDIQPWHDVLHEGPVSETGQQVLAGNLDHIKLNGVDRWWGCCHLTADNLWRRDDAKTRLIPPANFSVAT